MAWRRVAGAVRRPAWLAGAAVGLLVGAGVAAGVAAALWPGGAAPAEGAVRVHSGPVRAGPFLVGAKELRCGLAEIVGTHAEFYPKQGQFCRVRVTVTADEAAEDAWDSVSQRVATTGGGEQPVSLDAMRVKRQPVQFSLGGHATVEFDLWFDLPRAAQPTALLVQGVPAATPASLPLPQHGWPFGATG